MMHLVQVLIKEWSMQLNARVYVSNRTMYLLLLCKEEHGLILLT